MVERTEHIPTVVIGGGQAGLATGFHLAQRGAEFAILDAETRTGDQWRRRWDSLRLFTPARHSALPGLAHPNPRAFLGKDEIADYFERYAEHFGLPVRHDVRVSALERRDEGFALATSAGELTADRVVVATGATRVPAVPGFAAGLDASIRQLHSNEYRSAATVADGPVLVVGAGTSGAELALELAASHEVFLAGRPTAHVPDAVLRFAGGLYWAFINGVLTRSTPIGRRVARGFFSRGAPLIRVSMREVEAAGVRSLPRITGAADGVPVTADADGVPVATDAVVPRPATVIWATGYRPGLDWIAGLQLDEHGLPVTSRGVVESMPGLYLVGMPFQYGLTSGLIGGVGRDAGFVAGRIAPTR